MCIHAPYHTGPQTTPKGCPKQRERLGDPKPPSKVPWAHVREVASLYGVSSDQTIPLCRLIIQRHFRPPRTGSD